MKEGFKKVSVSDCYHPVWYTGYGYVIKPTKRYFRLKDNYEIYSIKDTFRFYPWEEELGLKPTAKKIAEFNYLKEAKEYCKAKELENDDIS